MTVSSPSQAITAPPAATVLATSRWNVTLGVLSGLAVALIWASWAVATRFAVTTTLEPQDVTFLRFSVASLFLWPVLVRKGFALKQIGISRAVMMVTGAGAPFMLLTSTGMLFAPASHVGTLMIGAMPLFVALLAALLFGERYDRPQLVGFAAVATGVACIGGYSLVFDRAGGEWRGDLLFLLCGCLFAGYTLAQRRSGITSWHAAALVNVCSCVIFAPIYFGLFQPNLLTASWSDVLFQGVVQGIGVAILGLYFYAEAVRRLGAPRAAVFGALTPGLAALLGIPLLGEIPSPATVIGIVLVTLGVMLVGGVLSRRRNRTAPAAQTR
ncbi:DMT family transporter [Arenibaculum sp.]|uniref:DMT family transporter n=1 Tax=Arenibaculum sp. TaxID=2865862 RepID=UPI002E111C12|nr:DMT family transporter [Arenibaculum sp.]